MSALQKSVNRLTYRESADEATVISSSKVKQKPTKSSTNKQINK